MVAPDAGDEGRGTVTEAVADPLSAVAPELPDGCVGLLLLEHAAPMRHTAAAAAASRKLTFRIVVV
jgi:hypothetical protein